MKPFTIKQVRAMYRENIISLEQFQYLREYVKGHKLSEKARIVRRGSNWYYISDRVQASHANLYTLLMYARGAGEPAARTMPAKARGE